MRRRLSAPPSTSYLRDFIYGAIDGAVTTFAVVAGVEGADLSASVVLVLTAFAFDAIVPGGIEHAFAWSAAMTGIAFFAVGSLAVV